MRLMQVVPDLLQLVFCVLVLLLLLTQYPKLGKLQTKFGLWFWSKIKQGPYQMIFLAECQVRMECHMARDRA